MSDNRLTTFQKLTKIFANDKLDLPTTTNMVVGGVDRELLRSKNREEIQVKKLEKQQQNYLQKVWQSANNFIKHQILQNEAKRIPSYYDYEKMEEYPIIGAALDVMMEESCTTDNSGKILNIYSESERVKKELEILFYDRLNAHTSIPMWTRNMCKYGDDLVFLNVDAEKGVIDCKQLPNIEIERDEGSLFDSIITNNKTANTVFRWKTQRTVEFKSWQVAHFRLITDDRRLPYGTSVLEKARRFWRNLLLTEDAMRTIRLLRASDRRVFYINIGNINQEDVPSYINEIANRYKRTSVVDPDTGQTDLKFNVLGIDQDYFIPIRDANDGSKIETIAGQTNLDIADIEYDLKLLVSALRVPKPYLNFEETVGDGKSLAMLDIRFSRTINRIQQCVIQELNKIAIVHLIAVGLEDEVHNFSLSMNNPSIQGEVLKTELIGSKIDAYKAATEAGPDGIAPMSHMKAKKTILNFTEKEIELDLNQQRFERAIGAELVKTEQIINRTGFFDKIDKMYGIPDAQYTQNADGTEAAGGGGGGSSFGGGMGDLGGGDMGADLGDTGEDTGDGLDGGLGGDTGGDLGAEGGDTGGPELGGTEPTTQETPTDEIPT